LHEANELSIDFQDFPSEVETLLTESMHSQAETQVTYNDEEDGKGTLLFTQSLNLKSVEILKLDFAPSADALVSAQAQYRFQKLAIELYRKKLMLAEFTKKMQSQNPLLLRTITSPTKSPGPK
jgi:hypothetical protein